MKKNLRKYTKIPRKPKTDEKGFALQGIIAIVVLFLIVGGAYYVGQKKVIAPSPDLNQIASSTVPNTELKPIITSISPTYGPVGTIVTIKGINLAGFEGDLDAMIENESGQVAFIQGIGSVPRADQTIRVRIEGQLCKTNNTYSGLPCASYMTVTPGVYNLFTTPWGKMSNKVKFTVTN